ncbi:hypothetical protein [Gordonia sputi]|nr:hypothetical protein A5766_21320 [Gordonia sp. 852002-51296_SCH5728562-b]
MFMLGFLIGPVVGFTMLDWAPKAFRDAFNIMTPPPVSPSLESPTAAYYASWFAPVGMVIVISVLLAWQWGRLGPRWKWLRSLFIGFSIGYIGLVALCGPIWISCELGGCAPT